MAIEAFLLKPHRTRSSYSARQLREKLGSLRAGMAAALPKDHVLALPQRRSVPRDALLAALDTELAAFAAVDTLGTQLQVARRLLQGRLPVLATAVEQISEALKYYGAGNPELRARLGVAPGKKRRKLTRKERAAATAKLNLTRARNGTAAEGR